MMDTKKIPNGGIWIPSEIKNSKWVLVALHGSGGSSADFNGLETIFNLKKLNYLYLNGPIRDYSHFRWYTETAQSRQQALEYLASIFNLLLQDGYSPSHIFIIGFSQGAALTFEFGLRYPHIFAGYVAISGLIEDLPALIHQMNPKIVQKGRWMVTHGTKDYNLSIQVMRQQVETLIRAGLRIHYQEYEKIHAFDHQMELPNIRDWISKMIDS